MREPTASAEKEGRRERIQFCALCDGGPFPRAEAQAQSQAAGLAVSSTAGQVGTSSASSNDTAPPSFASSAQDQVPSSSSRQSQYDVAARTSNDQKSTTTTTAAPDPAESISSLLLRGYSLLGSNCPNSICRGIPLVGYPRKKDGSKDTRRMCVSCGGRWVDQGDLGGMILGGAGAGAGAIAAGGAGGSSSGSNAQGGLATYGNDKGKGREAQVQESPRSKRRRELYGMSLDGTASEAGPDPRGEQSASRNDTDEDKELDALLSEVGENRYTGL
jgi:hypothetical protein